MYLSMTKSLYGLPTEDLKDEAPTELHEIKVLIDGEEYAKFEVTAQQGGLFTTIINNYSSEPDWHKW